VPAPSLDLFVEEARAFLLLGLHRMYTAPAHKDHSCMEWAVNELARISSHSLLLLGHLRQHRHVWGAGVACFKGVLVACSLQLPIWLYLRCPLVKQSTGGLIVVHCCC
jgi:hypothetical protein